MASANEGYRAMSLILSLFSGGRLIMMVAGLFVAGVSAWVINDHFTEFERLSNAETDLISQLADQAEINQLNTENFRKQESNYERALSLARSQIVDEKRWNKQAKAVIERLRNVPKNQDGPLADVLLYPPWLHDGRGKIDLSIRGSETENPP